jgi:hypothetical protein
MLGRLGPLVVCALFGAAASMGQNNILLWEGPAQNCYINQGAKSVEITGPGVFKLQAKVFGGMMGEINKLWIDPNQPVTGAVEIFIVRNPLEVGGLQHEPGAAQVKQIDIRSASGGGVVRELRITLNLAADAPIYATSMDTCAVGGSVLRDVIVSGAITGPLTITGMLKANLSCGSLQNLTVRAAPGGSLACARGSEAAS